MSAGVIRLDGYIGPGVSVSFSFDPLTGLIACEHEGKPRPGQRAEALRRYKALRAEFLKRVAAAIGGSVMLVDLDRDGQPTDITHVDEPEAGHA